MDRRVVAFVLCGLGIAVALGFALLTGWCGAMEVSSSAPGDSANAPQCVSSVHPLAWVFASLGVLALFAIIARKPWWAVGVGAVMTGFGILAGLSMGFFGVGSGVLVLAGGIVAATDKASRT